MPSEPIIPLVTFVRARCPRCESRRIKALWYKGDTRLYECREKKCRLRFKARVI